jgi:hypothetical protein
MGSELERANNFYDFEGYKTNVPWVYYKETSDLIFDQERIKMRVSFDISKPEYQVYNKLQYYLARYSLNGTFMGFEPLKRQLLLCDVSS